MSNTNRILDDYRPVSITDLLDPLNIDDLNFRAQQSMSDISKEIQDKAVNEMVTNLNKSAAVKGLMGAVAPIVGSTANKLLSRGLHSGAGDTISNVGGTVGGAISTVNPLVGGLVTAGSGIVGGAYNALFGSKLNKERINNIESGIDNLNSLNVDDSSNSAILNQYKSTGMGQNFTQSDIGKDGIFSHKARDTYRRLLAEQNKAQRRALGNFGNAAENVEDSNIFNQLSNYSYGGRLFNLKAMGGNLQTDWSNGVSSINNGGSHEQNQYGGVQMGTDNEGVPNRVEEGEVVWNDYVFSDRLRLSPKEKKQFKLGGNKDITYADAAKKLQKESEERPNDPISKMGLDAMMSRLSDSQEELKARKAASSIKKQINKMSPDEIAGLQQVMQSHGQQQSQEGVFAQGGSLKSGLSPTYLRYAPVIGASIGVGQSLFNKPDYRNADMLLDASKDAGQYTPVSYTPVHNYLEYNPMDRNYFSNKMHAQAAAGRRAILASSGNTSAGMMGLLQSDFNTYNAEGNLARQAEEYNQNLREKVESFNRGTNAMNSEMGLKAAMANQEALLKVRDARFRGAAQAAAMRENIDNARAASISANLTNFFDNLGNIGRENFARNMIVSNPALYYSIDDKGEVSYKNGYENLSEAEKHYINSDIKKVKKKHNKKSKGGYLTIN